MKLENWQILAMAVGAFASIVILDLLLKYQTDEAFRTSFPISPKALFARQIAPVLQAEEQMQEIIRPAEPTIVEPEDEG